MTVDQLRVFAEVARHLSMTRAAHALNLSQPAISAAISTLENRYQVHLFHRVGRRLELTEAGKALLPKAIAALQAMQQAVQSLDDLSGPLRGELSIAASQTVANYWLPPHLADFAADHPSVQLPLQVLNTCKAVESVLNGNAELGFIEGDLDLRIVHTQVIGRDHMGIYAAPEHSLVGRKLEPYDLEHARWVLREKGSGTRDHFVSYLASVGLSLERITRRLELPSNGAALEAIKTGNWIAAISDLAAAPHVAEGSIVRLNSDLQPRTFRMVWHKDRHLGRTAQAFISNIRGTLAEPPLGALQPVRAPLVRTAS